MPDSTPTETDGWFKDAIQIKRGHDLAIHQQIAEQIERLIAAGRLTPGQQLPTHKEMAKLLSVHPMTVSRSYSELQNQGAISQQRGRGTFVGNVDRTHTDIVVLLPDWSEFACAPTSAYATQQILAGMEEACREINAHLRILTIPTPLDDDGLARWSRQLRKHHRGVLTVMTEHEPLLASLAADGFPVLMYHRPTNEPTISNCQFGWYESIKLATEHLLSLGRKRISYLGPVIAKPIINHDGFDGFLAALEAANMPYYPRAAVRFPQMAPRDVVAEAVEQAIREDRIGDAIVCHSALTQEAGTSCVNLLKKHGRRVPEDVAVIGFEEDTTAASTDPPLTWAPIPRFEIGKKAVLMLNELMLDPGKAPLKHTVVPRLVPGRSCGGFPHGTGQLSQVYNVPTGSPASPEPFAF